ncbi:hypothetical protein TNCV_4425991 [Trichonephila clavipes]|nr:hypothetical protein TNCV_4425991 [Trichonephila clavipes]
MSLQIPTALILTPERIDMLLGLIQRIIQPFHRLLVMKWVCLQHDQHSLGQYVINNDTATIVVGFFDTATQTCGDKRYIQRQNCIPEVTERNLDGSMSGDTKFRRFFRLRIEAGLKLDQLLVEVTLVLQGIPCSGMYSKSGIVATKVSQGHRRAKTSSQNRYLALSGGHRRKTASQVACDLAPMSGRNVCMQTVKTSCRDLAFTLVSNFLLPGTANRRPGFVKPETVISRSLPDKVILVESLSGKRVELTFICPI